MIAADGTTGSILGIKTLIALRQLKVEIHYIISNLVEATVKYESDYTVSNFRALADHVYNTNGMAAPTSSGPFQRDGMIGVPCSVQTLSATTSGVCGDLIFHAADVMPKEYRKLVLAIRETPFNRSHLQNMLSVSQAGAFVFPPVLAVCMRPASVNDLVDHSVGRMLDLFDLDTVEFERWGR